MLSPFKTFLNNAGAKIFGLTSSSETMNTAEMATADGNISDEIITLVDDSSSKVLVNDGTTHSDQPHSSTSIQHSTAVMFQMGDDQLSQESCDDPPIDPLALDDSITSNNGQHSPLEIVDVDTLEVSHGDSDADLNAIDDNPLVDGPALETIVIQDSANNSGSNAQSDSYELPHVLFTIQIDENPLADTAAAESIVIPDGDCFGSCVQPESVDAEDGVRSDGSDSGLGLEPPKIQLDASPVKISTQLPLRTNLKRRSDTLRMDGEERSLSPTKRPKRNITFTDVNVYYFQRMQGFICVPSQGGCTLGMAATHMHHKRFSTLAEYAAEQRRAHRNKVQEQKRLSGLAASSSDESESDDEVSDRSDSEAEIESSGFMQTVSPRQRRVMLKAAGVRKIEPSEKDECKLIRVSREVCGCTCRGFCDPETCACAQMGIKCQVDRPNFPCGCSHDGCGNSVGRVEFNPARVRTHFIHTILRLELESKQQEPLITTHSISSTPAPVFPIASNNHTAVVSSRNTDPLQWHSHMGQSLAASSASQIAYASSDYATTSSTPDMYSLNGLITQPTLQLAVSELPNDINVRNGAAFDQSDSHSSSLLTHPVSQNHIQQHSLSPHHSQLPRSDLDQSVDMHFNYHSIPMTTNQQATVAHQSSSCLNGFQASSTSIKPTYMPSIYSPDSVSIVETPTMPSSNGSFHSPKSTISSYSDYGNMTGYQHSYLYSLMQHQSNAKALNLDDDIFGACAVDDTAVQPQTNGVNSATEFFEVDGSQTSADEYLDFSSDGGPKEFESDLEPIDFESEIGLSASIIDKSQLICVSSSDVIQTDDDDETVAETPVSDVHPDAQNAVSESTNGIAVQTPQPQC